MIWQQRTRTGIMARAAPSPLAYGSPIRYGHHARQLAGLIAPAQVTSVTAAAANRGQAAVAGLGHGAATSSRPKGK